jgi:TRAP-type transport system small permease protein
LAAACVVLFAMMALIVAEVILRGAFGRSLQIVDEYSGYMVVAVFFLGAAYALQEKALLRVGFLIQRLNRRNRRTLLAVYDLLALVFSVAVSWQLIRFTYNTWHQGVFAPTTAMTPLYLPELAMPFGMMLICLVLVSGILGSLRDALSGDTDDRDGAAGP